MSGHSYSWAGGSLSSRDLPEAPGVAEWADLANPNLLTGYVNHFLIFFDILCNYNIGQLPDLHKDVLVRPCQHVQYKILQDIINDQPPSATISHLHNLHPQAAPMPQEILAVPVQAWSAREAHGVQPGHRTGTGSPSNHWLVGAPMAWHIWHTLKSLLKGTATAWNKNTSCISSELHGGQMDPVKIQWQEAW